MSASEGASTTPSGRAVDGRRGLLAVALFVAAVALVMPRVFRGEFSTSLVNVWLISSIAAVGFYVILGLGGRFAFCQTLMMAIGAYGAAWMSEDLGFVVRVAGGVVITVIVATIFAVIVQRAEAFLFAIATLAFTQIGLVVFRQWTSFTGPNGTVTNLPFPEVAGVTFTTQSEMFRLLLVVMAIVLVLVALIEAAPLRRDTIAQQDQAVVATLMGVPARRIQIMLFVVGSAIGGLAGALYAFWQGSVGTDSFGVELAIGLFLMVILGGLRSMWGAVIGAAVFVWLPEVLGGIGKYREIVYGLLLVVTVVTMPDGLLGLGDRLRRSRAVQRLTSRMAARRA